jgi:glucosamine 6-phosphate synthetase-like amidotransferase/phosphosugar isomerase protein
MRRILELHRLHDYYNEKYFGGKLLHLTILLKKNQSLNGPSSQSAKVVMWSPLSPTRWSTSTNAKSWTAHPTTTQYSSQYAVVSNGKKD